MSLSSIINQINNLTGYNVPSASGIIISSSQAVGSGSVNNIVNYINGITGYNIPNTQVEYVSGANVAGPVIIYAPYSSGDTISTSGIAPGQIIRAEHILRIIYALSGLAEDTIIISGSLLTSGSNVLNGTLSLPFIDDQRFLYVSGGYVVGVDLPPSSSYAISSSYSISSSFTTNALSASYFSGSVSNAEFATVAGLALAGSGSFSGSFSGSGADLSNIPATAIVGLNLSQIVSGSVSASISPDNGLQVNTNVVAPSFSGSFSGSGVDLFNIPASAIIGLNLSQISSGSVSASISPDSGLQVNTNVTAASFSGSFSGSGADLSNIPASAIVGLNLSQISSGSYSASISDAGLLVNNTVVAPSFSGSLYGTASWAENVATASYASNIYNSDGTLTGNRIVDIGTYELDIASGSYKNLEIQNINGTGSVVVRNSLYISGAPSGSTLPATYRSGSEKFPQLIIEAVNRDDPSARVRIKAGGWHTSTWFGAGAMDSWTGWAPAGFAGIQNDAFGFVALGKLTTGFSNTAFGGWALGDTTTGARNVAVGLDALWRNVIGSRNTGIGNEAGLDNISGSRNIYIGDNAGRGILSGSNNTIIGTQTGLPAGLSNNIIISVGAGTTRARSFETGNWLFQNGGVFVDGGFRLDINGSTRFGTSNQMTVQSAGQVDMKNGLTVTGSVVAPNITGSLFGTASWANNATSSSYTLTSSYAVSSSHALTASYYNETDPIFVAKSGSFATTGSNTFIGNQTITGSLTITNDLVVLGSASITYVTESTLNIGTNLITVNTITPSVRFGGLAVIDSGSSPLHSGSFLFDSQKDEFIFVHQTSPITSSVFLLGPETYNNLGNEIYLTQNRVPKGSGIEHLNDSNISDDGNVVSINSNTQVTGSLTVTQGVSASLSGTASWASNAVTSSYIQNAESSSYSLTASYVNPLNQDVYLTGSLNANDAVNINGTIVGSPDARFNVYKNGFVLAHLGSLGSGNSATTGSLILWNNGLGTGSSGNVVISAIGDSYLASPSTTLTIRDTVPTPGYVFDVNGASNFRSGVSVTGSLIALSITGSLEGTASWASNASTASYVENAQSASYVLNAVSASQSATASFVQNAQSASYVLNAVSSSFAITSSYITASNVFGPFGSDSVISASFAVSASSVPASGVVGLNLTQIATGSVTASVNTATGSIFSVTSGSLQLLSVSSSGALLLSGSGSTNSITIAPGGINRIQTVGSVELLATSTLRIRTTNDIVTFGTAGSDRWYIESTGQLTTATDNVHDIGLSGSRRPRNVYAAGTGSIFGALNVTTSVTASTALISGSGTQRLTVIGSGSAQPLFTVQGSQGELFSIVDSLSGSLFSVNDISGLPIMEVFSDSTTLMGNYLAPSLNTTVRTTTTNSGSFTIYAVPTSSYDGIFMEYTAKSGSNARAGQFMAIWSGSSVNYTDNSTTDFGNTSRLMFTGSISGANMVVTGNVTTGSGWTIKAIIRSI